MSDSSTDYDYGPLQTFEITWQNGHVEKVQGHQVTTTGGGGIFGPGRKRFSIHGEINGHWQLVISALEDDVRIIRNVSQGEWVV